MKKLMVTILAIVGIAMSMGALSGCSVFSDAWKDQTYIIKYDANGGTGEMPNDFVDKGDNGSLPACKFERDGYESLIWSTDPDGNRLFGSELSLSQYLSTTQTSTVTLYAVWTTKGFSFEMSQVGFLTSGSITRYSGTAKDVIMPAYFDFSKISSSDWGYQRILNIYEPLFENRPELESVKNYPTLEIPDRLCYNCPSLKTFQTRQYVNNIGNQAFYQCTALTDLSIKTGCDSIGDEAFSGCVSIEKLVIQASVTIIGRQAFDGWGEHQTIEFLGRTENTFGNDWNIGCAARIVFTK